LAFVLNFIPTIGSIVASIPPVLVALVQFAPEIWPAVAVAGALFVIQQTLGNFFAPKIYGDRLNLSPVVILLFLLFWGAVGRRRRAARGAHRRRHPDRPVPRARPRAAGRPHGLRQEMRAEKNPRRPPRFPDFAGASGWHIGEAPPCCPSTPSGTNSPPRSGARGGSS
jgi:uncharacterized membrane protein